MKGKFIAVEGCEGAGKGTLIHRIKEEYPSLIITREPGGTKIGEQIRRILLSPAYEEMDSLTETLLFYAARNQHLKQKIIPLLNKGINVLSDRYNLSTKTYQIYGKSVDPLKVKRLELIIGLIEPDLTIYLDLPAEIGLKRVCNEDYNKPDRFHQEALKFHERVRKGYLELQRLNPFKIKKIDATKSPDQVFREAKRYLDLILET